MKWVHVRRLAGPAREALRAVEAPCLLEFGDRPAHALERHALGAEEEALELGFASWGDCVSLHLAIEPPARTTGSAGHSRTGARTCMDRGRWLAVLAVVDGPPAVADTPEDQAPEPNLAMLKVWAEYAKERFKAADTLIGEYRSWARQLVAAIGVVIGLEVTLLVRLALDGGSPLHASWRVLCLVVFFGMLGLQFWHSIDSWLSATRANRWLARKARA